MPRMTIGRTMAVSMAAVMSVLVMVSNSLVDVAFSSVVEVQRNDAACLTRSPVS